MISSGAQLTIDRDNDKKPVVALREIADQTIAPEDLKAADELGISEHTVKFHLGSAMTKLGAASRAEAVALAIRRGLISV